MRDGVRFTFEIQVGIFTVDKQLGKDKSENEPKHSSPFVANITNNLANNSEQARDVKQFSGEISVVNSPAEGFIVISLNIKIFPRTIK